MANRFFQMQQRMPVGANAGMNATVTCAAFVT